MSVTLPSNDRDVQRHESPFGAYLVVDGPRLKHSVSLIDGAAFVRPSMPDEVIDAIKRDGYETIGAE